MLKVLKRTGEKSGKTQEHQPVKTGSFEIAKGGLGTVRKKYRADLAIDLKVEDAHKTRLMRNRRNQIVEVDVAKARAAMRKAMRESDLNIKFGARGAHWEKVATHAE